MKRFIALFLVAVLSATITTVTASAHHGNGYDSIFPTALHNGGNIYCQQFDICQTDNRNYEFWLDPAMPAMKGAIRNRYLNYAQTTTIGFSELPGSQTPPAWIDAKWTDGSWWMDGSRYASTICEVTGSLSACNSHHVRVLIEDGIVHDGIDWWGMVRLACHEIGHTVGLEHGRVSAKVQGPGFPILSLDDQHSTLKCMRRGVTTKPWIPHWAGAHNTDQINDTY